MLIQDSILRHALQAGVAPQRARKSSAVACGGGPAAHQGPVERFIRRSSAGLEASCLTNRLDWRSSSRSSLTLWYGLSDSGYPEHKLAKRLPDLASLVTPLRNAFRRDANSASKPSNNRNMLASAEGARGADDVRPRTGVIQVRRGNPNTDTVDPTEVLNSTVVHLAAGAAGLVYIGEVSQPRLPSARDWVVARLFAARVHMIATVMNEIEIPHNDRGKNVNAQLCAHPLDALGALSVRELGLKMHADKTHNAAIFHIKPEEKRAAGDP